MGTYKLYEILMLFVLYGFTGWLLENLFYQGLFGGKGRRGFLRMPFSILYGACGLLGVMVFQYIPEAPLRLLLCLAGAVLVDAAVLVVTRVLSGTFLWNFSILGIGIAGITAFVLITNVQPFFRILVQNVPAILQWVVLIVCLIFAWCQLVDGVEHLLLLRSKGEVPRHWKNGYPALGK